ncbi:MAG: hypothetical protein O9331_19025 [Acidovorax sp.]|jgi:hypothetical protein|nr:hypothetical protein [Acidovorax sp.]
MDEFQHRKDGLELSMASLARLTVLLRLLRIGADLPNMGSNDLNRRLQRRSHLWRGHFRPDPLVILQEHEGEARSLIGAVEEAVQHIARRIDSEWRRSPVGVYEGAGFPGDSVWSICAVTFCVEQIPILRGEIELLKTEPVAAGIPDEVVEFLVTVPGTTDQITRETHGHWGYHYHYLDSKGRRSDTLLTFDRGSTNVTNPNLCWERHAEGGKFKARAGAWGSDKRQSVYSVCHPHASSFGLSAFKRPASDAEIVWPLAGTAAAKSVI